MNEVPIRVLVVDDSAFARKVVREVLEQEPRLQVVGTAADGLEALQSIGELKPEVVTLDLMMPALDGLSLLRALPPAPPSVVIVSVSAADSEIAIEALQAGAFDLVKKPTALATARLYELGRDLVDKVIAAGESRRRGRRQPAGAPPAPLRTKAPPQLVVIGTSTGGPQALTRLLAGFPADLPVPVAIALHIPRGYTHTMAERLNKSCAIEVREAAEASELRPGLVVLTQGGSQLSIARVGGQLLACTSPSGEDRPFAPSVDRLFESASRAVGAGVVGVVLTGMGDDGIVGARAIRQAGGVILTEAEASGVVYGMPRAVVEAGLSLGEAHLSDMAHLIVATVQPSRSS
jgi:two-component system chemotaxis response regulator CheB